MERAKSFGRENVSANLPESFSLDLNLVDDEQKEDVKCFADKFKFQCVWQEPKPSVELINQIMNNLNIQHENEDGDQTPSNLSALLSASFKSGVFDKWLSDEDIDVEIEVPTSTPHAKDRNEANSSSVKADEKKLNFKDFNDASPILFTSRYRQVFMKRRCRLSFDLEESVDRKSKLMKI